jgi:hypothetical protein
MLALVLVSIQIVGVSQAFTTALDEHTLVAETVLEKHSSYSVELTVINLSIINVVLTSTFVSFNPLN